MATEKLDPRAALAKMEAEEKAANDAAEALTKANSEKREAILKELRDADLDDVRTKCKLHGFTATDLRTFLKTKGAKKATPRKSTPRKTATKRRNAKA